MSKDETKVQINKVLDQFSGQALEDLFSFFESIERKHNASMFNGNVLDKILNEDKELLEKLFN